MPLRLRSGSFWLRRACSSGVGRGALGGLDLVPSDPGFASRPVFGQEMHSTLRTIWSRGDTPLVLFQSRPLQACRCSSAIAPVLTVLRARHPKTARSAPSHRTRAAPRPCCVGANGGGRVPSHSFRCCSTSTYFPPLRLAGARIQRRAFWKIRIRFRFGPFERGPQRPARPCPLTTPARNLTSFRSKRWRHRRCKAWLGSERGHPTGISIACALTSDTPRPTVRPHARSTAGFFARHDADRPVRKPPRRPPESADGPQSPSFLVTGKPRNSGYREPAVRSRQSEGRLLRRQVGTLTSYAWRAAVTSLRQHSHARSRPGHVGLHELVLSRRELPREPSRFLRAEISMVSSKRLSPSRASLPIVPTRSSGAKRL